MTVALYKSECGGNELCIKNEGDSLFPDEDDVFSPGNVRFVSGGQCAAKSTECEPNCGPATACVETSGLGAGYACMTTMFDRPDGQACFYNDHCTSGLCVDNETEDCDGCGTHRLCSVPSSDCAQACGAGRVCATDPESSEARCLIERPDSYPRSE